MKRNSVIVMFFLFVVLSFYFVMSLWGRNIHENACATVEYTKAEIIALEDGSELVCLPKDCIKAGKVYEIFKQENFFDDTFRVKAIEVEVGNEISGGEMISLLAGVDKRSMSVYALIPAEGLEDDEAVIVDGKWKNKGHKTETE